MIQHSQNRFEQLRSDQLKDQASEVRSVGVAFLHPLLYSLSTTFLRSKLEAFALIFAVLFDDDCFEQISRINCWKLALGCCLSACPNA